MATKKETWIAEAQNGEQGDFCDVGSGYKYEVGNLTDATLADSKAKEDGGSAIWIDEPVVQSDSYNVPAGQQFTILECESDSQGVQFQRVKP